MKLRVIGGRTGGSVDLWQSSAEVPGGGKPERHMREPITSRIAEYITVSCHGMCHGLCHRSAGRHSAWWVVWLLRRITGTE